MEANKNSTEGTNQKRWRIAFTLNRFYPEIGGAETNLFFQVRELAKSCDVTVFTPRRRLDTPASEVTSGFQVKRLRDWRNWKGIFPNIQRDTFMPRLFFEILFGKFDAVQAFPALNFNNIMALIAAKIKRIPFILCSFDLLDYAEIQKKTGKIDPNCLQNYVPKLWRRLLFKLCNWIFAISEREMAVFRRYNPNVGYSPVPVLPEEYEADSSQLPDVRKKYGISPDAMLYFSLGRVSRIKGQDLAVDAFIQIAPKVPDSVLCIVGRADYEPDFDAAMREKIKAAGLENRVFFTGMVERSEVIAFLKSGDIHIIPVRFMNSGAVVVESWAAGTPVIQSDAVDPNFVEEKINGYLFPAENVPALAKAMLQAADDRRLLPQMGEAGRVKVQENYTYRHLIQLYLDTYQKLCR